MISYFSTGLFLIALTSLMLLILMSQLYGDFLSTGMFLVILFLAASLLFSSRLR